MAGGQGVEYYFGYKLPQNDLACEDWRSRDRSWDYCRIALEFFSANAVPFWEMKNADALVARNGDRSNLPERPATNLRLVPGSAQIGPVPFSASCLAKAGEVYLVYLPNGGAADLDLAGANGPFAVQWFNPRAGGPLADGPVKSVRGGGKVSLGHPPADVGDDWLAVVRRRDSRRPSLRSARATPPPNGPTATAAPRFLLRD
jgi:Putative collagen-binding domain of a collagenase